MKVTKLLAVAGLATAGFAFANSPAAPTAKADPVKGKALVEQVCAACHGADGNSVAAANPSLAGQHADYLYVALKAYQTEGNAQVGRGNAIMGGMAKQYTNAELKAMSNYLSSVEGDLKVVPESRFR